VRGIATIDRQPGSDIIAVWLTSAVEPFRAGHVNAVLINAASDPEAIKKVRSLTRCCGVLVTDGSSIDALPLVGEPLTIGDIEDLVTETESHQEATLAAIAEYKRRTRSASLKDPVFPVSPKAADHTPLDDVPSQRALAAADFLAKAWSVWLRTDDERRRRTARPKTGETPWIMPAELNSPDVAELPAAFAAKINEQALV
jgi:hypothetical protein